MKKQIRKMNLIFFRNISYLSKIFQPINIIPKDTQIVHKEVTSKSQKLMLDLGIIRQANPGFFYFLPLGIKSLEKLIKIVDKEMKQIGGQKIEFPTLTNTGLWKTSGRLETVSSELFVINDRHKHSYILSPTYEEAASELLASVSPISYKQLPLRLYQITSKFRDEIKPRFGSIRARQFLMKDMYSFDMNLECANKTYEAICASYNNVFKTIGVDFVKVLGSAGHMGGSLSHEFHYKADIGEDKIVTCCHCQYTANTDLLKDEICPNCGLKDLTVSLGIEVGHTFLLGDKYSKPLKAMFKSKSGQSMPIQMGSYGLGLSRIIAAAIEVLSSDNEIRWPLALAPFKIIILPPKVGSKEETHSKVLLEKLCKQLNLIPNFEDDFLIDDRTSQTIGRRFLDAKKMGYPFVIVLGQKIMEDPPLYEVNNLIKKEQLLLNENQLFSYLTETIQ